LGHGRDTGGDVPAADPAASSRDLFFPPVVFKLFDGEGFILQVHRVFTRIRSGATAVVSGGGALGSTLSSEVAVRTMVVSRHELLGMAASAWGEKTLRVSASIYKSTAAPPTAGWISLQTADSAAAPDPSTSSNRYASSRGLGYI
jgi:hypothetical protein